MGWLQTLALLLGAGASAASISESMRRGKEHRLQKRKLDRGMILPKEAARELEHRIGGRVAVGQDHEGDKLVIMRARTGSVIPQSFAGYRVQIQPKITLRD